MCYPSRNDFSNLYAIFYTLNISIELFSWGYHFPLVPLMFTHVLIAVSNIIPDELLGFFFEGLQVILDEVTRAYSPFNVVKAIGYTEFVYGRF